VTFDRLRVVRGRHHWVAAPFSLCGPRASALEFFVWSLPVALIALCAVCRAALADPVFIPAYSVVDSRAPAVTGGNLHESDRFWPYRTKLIESWLPPSGAATLGAGTEGALIRVGSSGTARIDFGRVGVYDVPVSATDLVEHANRIRLGEEEKTEPNLLRTIGPRLVDSNSDVMRPFSYGEEYERDLFLCLFADPEDESFDAIVGSMTPLAARHGALVIVFPQGRVPDRTVGRRLRALGSPVPFVLDHVSEAYTRSLLAADVAMPAVLLQTGDGRLLFAERWEAETAARIASVIQERDKAAL